MLMTIPIGDSIIAGSALFATMGVIIKVITVKAETARLAALTGNQNKNGPNVVGVSRDALDQILDKKLNKIVTDPVCLARHHSLERHVTDIYTGLAHQIQDVKKSQDKIFDKLDEIKRCQMKALAKGDK